MENDSQKLEIVETLINKVFVAHDTNISPKKLIADFWPHIPFQNQLDYLKELKKKKAIGNFKKASDCFYITNLNKSLLIKEQKELLKAAKPSSESIKKPRKLSFEESTGEISLGEEKCQIPINTNQYFLCKKMFGEPFGTKVKEIDILDMIDWFKDTKRSVYDAMLAVNKKVKDALSINHLMRWRNNHIWIDYKV